MKVYEAVLDQLIGSGVSYFAGMVGSTSAPYVSNLAGRNDARYIGVRHEQVAASMIEATARLTGRPGCVMVHGGSGLLAASLGIASAALDSTPMIVLTATQERKAMEGGWWQTMDVLSPLKGLAKWQRRIERPDQAVGAVREALLETVTGRPGIAQLDFPIDVSTEDLGTDSLPEILPHAAPMYRPWPDPQSVQKVVDMLRGAERPVILIGGGANFSGAGEEILKLAERLHCPVIDGPTSRGVVPETHPLVLGPSGIQGVAPVGQAILEADFILAIGSRLSDLQLSRSELLPEGVPVVQVNIDGAALGKDRLLEVGIVSDARAFAVSLNAALDEADLPVPDARRQWAAERGKDMTKWLEAWFASEPDNGKVQPHELARALYALPPDTIFAHGAGDHSFYGRLVRVASPGAHLSSTRLGSMGCGLGLAMGAKLARPEQTVVACIGDGDLMLQIGDLETMARENIAVVVVVFNNFRLGSQRKRVEAYGPVTGTDHTNPDFARLAELFGCRGFRVDKPGDFAAALSEALSTGMPCVIDALIDRDALSPRTGLSRKAT